MVDEPFSSSLGTIETPSPQPVSTPISDPVIPLTEPTEPVSNTTQNIATPPEPAPKVSEKNFSLDAQVSNRGKGSTGIIVGVVLIIVIIAVIGYFYISMSSSPINLAKNNSEVKDFILQHPAADISLSAYSFLEPQTDNNFWDKNCTSDLNANEYYVLKVEDANSTYKALFDKSNMTLLCGVVQKTSSSNIQNIQNNTQNQQNNQLPALNPQENCIERWTCANWSACDNNIQTRTCTDSNNCGTDLNKPAITQQCSAICTENWSCDNWSTCISNTKSRTCTDLNSCGTTLEKPEVMQNCTDSPVPNTCVESWACTGWTECVNNTQTLICHDQSNCGTNISNPSYSQACTAPTTCQAQYVTPTEYHCDGGAVQKKWQNSDCSTNWKTDYACDNQHNCVLLVSGPTCQPKPCSEQGGTLCSATQTCPNGYEDSAEGSLICCTAACQEKP